MTRVVVVGHGMVGSRFVEDLVARDPRLDVTVLGAEEYEPYNRVLLSEVVAGTVDVAAITLPGAGTSGAAVRHGADVVAVDRAGRHVVTRDGARTGYDVLVLATGARARVPRLAGLRGPGAGAAGGTSPGGHALPPGVHALRTLDDAREIVAATVNARRAVVLGGGVLGLEAACGLAGRGLRVTVVHGGEHLMDRQLDGAAAQAVARGLGTLGVGHRVGARAAAVDLDDGRLTALVLADGERLPADLLLLTAGTVPETGLAAAAGLSVGRGVLVGENGATSDQRIYAIGDCAEPPGGATGLVAQGWDQARRLAARLVGGVDAQSPAGPTGPPPSPPTDVVRVKAHGLEVVTMGVGGSRSAGEACHRTVRLSDPAAGRHVEVVVAGGVVVGATCVGDGPVAADLTTAYTRRTPVPRDPAQLLLRPVTGAGGGASAADPSPTLMPDRTTVCRCNGVTKGDLVACWRGGARDLPEVARASRATTGCGGCADAVCGILDWLARSDPPTDPPTDPPPGRPGDRPGDRLPDRPAAPVGVGARTPVHVVGHAVP